MNDWKPWWTGAGVIVAFILLYELALAFHGYVYARLGLSRNLVLTLLWLLPAVASFLTAYRSGEGGVLKGLSLVPVLAVLGPSAHFLLGEWSATFEFLGISSLQVTAPIELALAAITIGAGTVAGMFYGKTKDSGAPTRSANLLSGASASDTAGTRPALLKACFAGIGILVVAHAAWFVSLLANQEPGVLAFLTWLAQIAAGLVSAFLAPRRKILIGASMAIPSALLLVTFHTIYQAFGHAVDFPGLRGGFILFKISLVYGVLLSATGAAVGWFLASRLHRRSRNDPSHEPL